MHNKSLETGLEREDIMLHCILYRATGSVHCLFLFPEWSVTTAGKRMARHARFLLHGVQFW